MTTHTRQSVEILESRIAPAAITAPGTFTYTDSDGDVVKVKIEGLFTSASFLDSSAADVNVSGGDIASIVVTGAGKDFAITFADTNSGVGGDIIQLGKIGGAGGARLPKIAGIFTVPAADGDTRYDLAGYYGTTFALGGGLRIFGQLTGATLDGAGLDINAVPIDTSIYFSKGIALAATASVTDAVAGSIHIQGTLDGSLTVGSVLGQLQVEDVTGTLQVHKNVAGRIVVGDVTSLIEIQGSLTPTGRISTLENLNLKVVTDLSGSLQVVGDLSLNVGRDITTAEVLVGHNLILDAGGSIKNSRIIAEEQFHSTTGVRFDVLGSAITGGKGLQLDIGRAVASSRLSSGVDDMDVAIGGKVLNTQIVGGDDMALTIGGSVTNSRILPDGQLDIAITGSVSRSTIGSASSALTVSVGGKLASSRLLSGGDASVTATGAVSDVDLFAGANVILDAKSDVIRSKFAMGSDLTATVGGNLVSSQFLPANALFATIAKNVKGSTLASLDNSTEITVGGTISASGVQSGDSITVEANAVAATTQFRAAANFDINAKMKMAGYAIAGGNVTITTLGAFTGTVSAGQGLTLTADSVKIAGGIVGVAPAVVVAPTVGVTPVAGAGLDVGAFGGFRGLRVGGDVSIDVAKDFAAPFVLVGGNAPKLHVGGKFAGTLRVAGNLTTGATTGTTTVIGGAVAKSAFIEIGGDIGSSDSSPQLIFGGAFLGRLQVGGALKTDLQFNADVNRLSFDGAIGTAILGDEIANIIVKGTLKTFSSASLFERIDALTGRFVDGSGTITGLLDTTVAAIKVTPTSA